MKTRKTERKLISLPGRYSTGLGGPHDVVLRDLSVGGCRFDTDGKRISLGAPVQIFVAATGPHRAIVKWVADGEVGLSFLTPMSEQQFNSFQASHIPDPSEVNIVGEFDDISDVRPQRFC